MNKNTSLIISLAVILLILSGIWINQESNTVSAAEISREVGESGLSYKHEGAIGTPGEPYVFSPNHLNQSEGLFIDSSGALYVAEKLGMQVLKYDADGNFVRSFGVYGQPWHHDNFIYQPKSVAVTDNGHVYVTYPNAIKEYSAEGDVIRTFPEDEQWASGSDNEHFDYPYDLVFSSDESRLFVSDAYNQRVQVFSFDGDGNFVYEETISSDTATMTDGAFNGIRGMDIDSLGRLYIVDYNDFVVHRCEPNTGWHCTHFFGESGVSGDDLTHLNYPVDVFVDSSNNIFIADNNNRILKCDDTGDCAVFVGGEYGSGNDQFKWINGITGDSSGNIYVSDKDNFRVQVFDASGTYLKTYGTTGVPYMTDESHLNTPVGVALDSNGDTVVVESYGYRLVKFDSDGNQLWMVGEPGVWGDNNEHFGTYWGKMEGNPAIDEDHKIYVADTTNNRIQIFNSDGIFQNTFGSYGQGNEEFDFPTFIFIDPINGDIYISDTYNHRIQIFNSSLIYKGTIGVTAESGSDNEHFDCPTGVVVDQEGNIYVGDYINTRVQKCVLNGGDYTCETFIGETGAYDWNFGHVTPQGLAIDNAGRIYVSDNFAARIQIFDSNGAFLTSIEGNNSASLGYPMGIAVDQNGYIYAAIRENHAIQIFSPGIPDWKQSNINGFGDKNNAQIPALATFNDYLYAGTWKDGEIADSAEIWRTADGSAWEMVDTREVNGCAHLIEYDAYLYCGSWDGRIWRTVDGTTWTEENTDGFGFDYAGIARFAVYEDMLYASTWTDSETEIWRTDDGSNWTFFEDFGDDDTNASAISSEIHNGNLYWGTANWYSDAQLWKTDGTAFTAVFSDGLGLQDNFAVSSLASFDGFLYAVIVSDGNIQVFRSNDDIDWESVLLMSNIGSTAHGRAGLEVNQNELFLVTQNYQTGTEVWKTTNGSNWEQVGFGGFGDNNNESTYWDNGVTTFNEKLFIGTINSANGGEIWRYEESGSNIYLPLILNNYQAPAADSWKKVASPTTQTLNAVKMLSVNNGWAVGNAGTILRWSGSAWSGFTSPTTSNLNGLALFDSDNAWAVGDSGTIIHWNGSTWQSYTSPTSLKLNDIYLLNENNGWIVGDSGTLLYWNGSNWQLWASPTTYNLNALDFLSNTDGWAVGGYHYPINGKSEILKWNGSEWTVYDHGYFLPAIDALNDIDMVSPTFGIAMGMNNNAEMWYEWYWHWYHPNEFLTYHFGVDFLSESDGWSVGWVYQESNILHWEDTTWEREPCPVDSELMDIYMLDSDHGWIVGAEGVILRYGF